MANAIIFTDRAPAHYGFDNLGFYSAYYSPAAGAYKIASVLRDNGFSCLVIPNCLQLSLEGIKQIIVQNSQNLLWVGVSTTFLNIKGCNLDAYRSLWHTSEQAIIGIDTLFGYHQSYQGSAQLVWESQEINAIADLCKNYQASVLVGGAWVTLMKNVTLQKVRSNVHVITGNAETVVETFTKRKAQDAAAEPPYVYDNRQYDDVAFKSSTISWHETDQIDARMWLPLEVARGCAFNCAYCNYDRKSSRDTYKDPNKLKEELLRNYELFGVSHYMILDDLYNDSKEKVRVLYDKVWSQLPFKVEWASYMRLDMIWADPESADFIQQSGARMGSFGIETLHDRAGKKVGKGLGRTRIIETLEILKERWKTDTLVHAFFLAGLPHEPLESIIESIEWTRTTDLLFCYKWAPLWITPPDHFAIVNEDKINTISKQIDQFGVTWPEPDIWQNAMGVRFDQVDALTSEAMRNLPLAMRLSYADYADLRTAGMSHDDIVGIKQGKITEDHIRDCTGNIKNLIDQRLRRILTIQDS